MDDGNLYSEDVSKLWSVSTKFAYQMKDLNNTRFYLRAVISFIENLRFLLDEPFVRICGSVGEGTWYPVQIVQNKDIDLMTIYSETLAVENAREKDEYDRETFVYLVERENCCPGYCRLKLLNEGSSPLLKLWHFNKELNGMKYIRSSSFRLLSGLFLCNIDEAIQTFFPYPNLAVGRWDERGPANSIEYIGMEIQMISCSLGCNITKVDHVWAINHPKWPSCALEWRDRIRPYGWPSQQQIRNIVKKGIYLVPVGSKQSEREREDIEWRYSFNEAEQVLVRSFNFTQVKCYVLLKMLVSENVTPRFEDDVISSYHIKTLMFWAIEQTDPKLWVSRNLVELVFRILNVLFHCVTNLSCSSYFILDENLFVGKVTLANRDLVSQVLSDVIMDGWIALTRLNHFARDDDFIQSLYQDNDIMYVEEVEPIVHNRLMHLSSSIVINEFILELLKVVQSCNITEVDKMDENFKEVINNLLQKIHKSDDIRGKEILQNILSLIICSYGTHVLSLSRCPSAERTENCIMEELGLFYTNDSCKSNLVECIAKHANYAYVTGDFQSTISAAEQLLDRYAHFPLRPYGVTSNIPAYSNYFEHVVLIAVMNGTNVDELIDNLCFVGCIIFLKNEMYALPDDSRVEMFCVLGAGNQLQTMCCNWFGLCPFVYVTYLAFLVNFDLGRKYNAEAYLRIMEFMCRTSPSAFEPSSLNLLGACYIKMMQPEKALDTFCTSMKRQRGKRNAVVWHVARLLWRKLKDRWTNIH